LRRILGQLDFNLREKLVKYNVWSAGFCGDENWRLRKLDQKYMQSCEMWYWRGMEKIS